MRTKILFFPIACAIAIGGLYVFQRSVRPVSSEVSDGQLAQEGVTLVKLTDFEAQRALIETTRSVRRSIQSARTVSGRLIFDDQHHVEVRVAAAGVLTELEVLPGEEVKRGDVLAEIQIPAAGEIRAEINRRTTELKLANNEYRWRKAVCDGVVELVGDIQAGQEIVSQQDIQPASANIGALREELVSAYNRAKLANQLLTNVSSAARSGAISSRILHERQSELQTAESALRAKIEQATFDANKACQAAEAGVREAEQLLAISKQKLDALLGGQFVAEANSGDMASQSSLSSVRICAPIGGKIVARNVSRRERVEAGNLLFTIADIRHLWVRADVRSRTWSMVSLKPGMTIRFHAPLAARRRTYTAEVLYIGGQIDVGNDTAEVVSQVIEADESLLPGMFVRIDLPTGESTDVIAVPETAVVDIDGVPSVFVETGVNQFEPKSVTTGISGDGWTEITKGLQPGVAVASQGAFTLKSELLLTDEEE